MQNTIFLCISGDKMTREYKKANIFLSLSSTISNLRRLHYQRTHLSIRHASDWMLDGRAHSPKWIHNESSLSLQHTPILYDIASGSKRIRPASTHASLADWGARELGQRPPSFQTGGACSFSRADKRLGRWLCNFYFLIIYLCYSSVFAFQCVISTCEVERRRWILLDCMNDEDGVSNHSLSFSILSTIRVKFYHL